MKRTVKVDRRLTEVEYTAVTTLQAYLRECGYGTLTLSPHGADFDLETIGEHDAARTVARAQVAGQAVDLDIFALLAAHNRADALNWEAAYRQLDEAHQAAVADRDRTYAAYLALQKQMLATLDGETATYDAGRGNTTGDDFGDIVEAKP